MTRRSLPLVGIVVLLAGFAFFVAMGERAAPKDEAAVSPVVSPTVDIRSAAPDAPKAVATEAQDIPATPGNTDQSQEGTFQNGSGGTPQEKPAVVTGCGKPTPCPNRDCATCPYNIYLK